MKYGFMKTFFSIILIHIGISMAFAMVFGINHPFGSQYRINDLNALIASSMSLAFVLYALAGYFYVVAKQRKQKLLKHIIISSILITIILLTIWSVVRYLTMNGVSRNIWILYVLSNYPSAIIYNAIVDLDDFHAIILSFTTISPALGLTVGSFLRLIFEPQWRKETKTND